MLLKRYKLVFAFLLLAAAFSLAWVFYNKAQNLSVYEGLPTVPCFDPTLMTKQKFSFSLKILVNGQEQILPGNIGHDYADCLRVIYTNNSSGTVYVKANDTSRYTLGNFFDVWRKTFNKEQFLDYKVDGIHHLKITVNGREVSTYRATPLFTRAKIEVIYE